MNPVRIIKVAVVLVKLSDSGEPPYSAEKARFIVFGGDKSVANYFHDLSSARWEIQGDVFGWFTSNQKIADLCPGFPEGTAGASTNIPGYNCDLSKVEQFWSAAIVSAGTNLQAYDRIIWSIHGMDAAGFGGNREIFLSAKYGFHRGTIIHEVGHSLGLMHASEFDCSVEDLGGASAVLFGKKCARSRYGNRYDPMGEATLYTYSAYMREILGLIDAQNTLVASKSGQYILGELDGSFQAPI